MQTSKYLFAAGVLAAVILPLQVQGGPDNEEQAKMREALRRALEQPGTPAPQPAAAAKPAATPAPVEPVATTPPPQAQPTPPPVTPVAPPPPAPVTPTVVVATPQTFEPVPPPDDAAAIARAREAMRQKMQELQTAPAPATNSVAAVAPPPVAKPVAPVAPPLPAAKPETSAAFATSSYKPIDAPASPFSSSKQAKLADLLSRYRADSITAQDYHAQRAAIIAEP